MATRAEIEALLGTLVPGEPLPSWARNPGTELHFYAALLAHASYVTPVYNEADELVEFQGISLKNGAA